jgi:integrase
MIGLFKRSNGVFYVQYSNPKGTRSWRSTGRTNRSDAIQFLRTFEPAAKRSSTTIAELLSMIENNYRRIYRPGTLGLYKFTLDAWTEINPGVPLSGVSKLLIQDFIRERLKTIKPVSVNRDLRTLRSAFNHALSWNLIESNPFSRFPLLKIPEAPPLFFTPVEFALLASTLRYKNHNLIANIASMGVYTGLRRGELLSLEWKNVSFANSSIKVVSSDSYKVKGGKVRSVPIIKSAEIILRKYYREGYDGLVFGDGSHRFAEQVTRMIKRTVIACGLNKKLHFHSLRHTYASWLVQRGVSLYIVQKLLGHSSPSMTQIYSHLSPDDLGQYARLIEN